MGRRIPKSRQDVLHAERLATIGRTASSICHDLRHPLTVILAYAEFLAQSDLDDSRRQEFYQEIRLAVSGMTDLIGSLLEYSKAQPALRPAYGNAADVLERAIQSVRLRPEFRGIAITLSRDGPVEGWYDSKKIERVFQNLLVNACEAVQRDSGNIEVSICRTREGAEIRVSDNGSGIPESIRNSVFQPFVSQGKEYGTGLGLAVVQKVVQDHGGDVRIEATGEFGTVVTVQLPLSFPLRENWSPQQEDQTDFDGPLL